MEKEEYFCNKCGQPINYWEYNYNLEGFCDACEEEEYDKEPEEEDWTDNTYWED